MPDETSVHEIRMWHRLGDEQRYTAECACGWKGKARVTTAAARSDADGHVIEQLTHDALPAVVYVVEKWVEWLGAWQVLVACETRAAAEARATDWRSMDVECRVRAVVRDDA